MRSRSRTRVWVIAVGVRVGVGARVGYNSLHTPQILIFVHLVNTPFSV